MLTVEDEGLVVAGLRACLERLGHDVVGLARDGREAVEHASRLQPDLIIMDIRLPGMDGIEAARIILGSTPVPIVILTAYADEELVRRASAAGVMGYVLKPVDERQIHAVIEVALARFEEFSALRRETEDLKEALETRKVVEKAKGILMERLNLPEAEAFRRMQESCRRRRMSMKDFASKILEAEDLLEALGGDS